MAKYAFRIYTQDKETVRDLADTTGHTIANMFWLICRTYDNYQNYFYATRAPFPLLKLKLKTRKKTSLASNIEDCATWVSMFVGNEHTVHENEQVFAVLFHHILSAYVEYRKNQEAVKGWFVENMPHKELNKSL